jgi:hypothetical protein
MGTVSFFYGEGNEDHQLGTGLFVCKRIISMFRRAEFVSDRKLCIILRGCWCNIIILNVHTPCEDKSGDVKDSFCDKLGHVFDQFPRCDMKILFSDISAKIGREDIFKLVIRNENSHEVSNDYEVRVVNFVTSKNLVVRSTMFPHHNIHKYSWSFPERKMYNHIDHVLIRDDIKVYLMSDLSEELTVILPTIW